MPTFMCFLNWTDQGAKNAKDANKRFQASKSMAEKLRGKLLSAYVTTGHYDVVLTLEMANGEAMIKFASAVSASGIARTTTVRAYTPDEFSKLAADAPKMWGRGGTGGRMERPDRRCRIGGPGLGTTRWSLGRATPSCQYELYRKTPSAAAAPVTGADSSTQPAAHSITS